jgi:hypothetical protein
VHPPTLANVGAGDCLPLGRALELDVGEELTGFGVEEDRVGPDAVIEEGLFEFRPDGLMPSRVFVLRAGIDGHHKCFTNHASSFSITIDLDHVKPEAAGGC